MGLNVEKDGNLLSVTESCRVWGTLRVDSTGRIVDMMLSCKEEGKKWEGTC
jgi:hypothetical protein